MEDRGLKIAESRERDGVQRPKGKASTFKLSALSRQPSAPDSLLLAAYRSYQLTGDE